MAIIDSAQYTLIPFLSYKTLNDKIQALLSGEILFIKKFEKNEGADVLARLEQKKFTVSQISYDISVNDSDPRYWVTFNLGLNDLSLFTCYRFSEDVFGKEHKYMINDVVSYTSLDGQTDTAIVEEVYQHNTDPTKFAYKLSRDEGLYVEEELVKNVYM
ncbi:virion structural protein [Bacillus phage vB_BmeM-Goe8]|uniref:Uncharacterized protein n=1 Tax=Bacillus phage vB_BmeM-Goe8 TaxID=2593638 RepID=A0A516KMZ5_9CAUD|nr:virion structural protein [Bacillus phage vB_BmeM-Goe8]QDP42978.1 hypothetical protein Goe8_c02050 [Bacillus phage vB_BmeM-Goe8]